MFGAGATGVRPLRAGAKPRTQPAVVWGASGSATRELSVQQDKPTVPDPKHRGPGTVSALSVG
ncbi:MAG: hypothetical protein CSA58_08890 [Micrococcales bacterium]|nr:MAG: hypothetical protein CSA58_11150 [Micrococcales bacterium]PIE26556.1 MAG: hypothetical protein CSA58_08890 [Micrococcales bacterium]